MVADGKILLVYKLDSNFVIIVIGAIFSSGIGEVTLYYSLTFLRARRWIWCKISFIYMLTCYYLTVVLYTNIMFDCNAHMDTMAYRMERVHVGDSYTCVHTTNSMPVLAVGGFC